MKFFNNPLFDGITEEECGRMMECFHVKTKKFLEGETIARYDGTNRTVGILSEGRAEMVRIDQDGNRSVLEFLTENGVFGETLAFPAPYDSITVESVTDTEILFLEYDDITKRCENACLHHSRLVENMFRLIAEKSRTLSRRVEVLSGRTIREKLMTFFRFAAEGNEKASFRLPFSMTTLSEYISADRAATARELKRMKDDGLVSVENKVVTIL